MSKTVRKLREMEEVGGKYTNALSKASADCIGIQWDIERILKTPGISNIASVKQLQEMHAVAEQAEEAIRAKRFQVEKELENNEKQALIDYMNGGEIK